jgi:Tfp pilus assembly protein PilF
MMTRVRKPVFLFIGVLVILLIASDLNASIINRRQKKRMGSSVVQISVYDWRGIFLRQGWGFFINEEGHIITVRHILDGGFYVEATTIDRESYIIDKVYSEDAEGNLIRVGLEMKPEQFSYVVDADGLPDAGEHILVGGGIGCEPGAFLDGYVEEVRQAPVFGFMMKIDSPFASAGSPIFTMDGNLVGIVIFRLENGSNTAWAVPVGRIGKLMANGEHPQDHLVWAESRHVNWLDTPTGSYLMGLAHHWSGEHALALPNLRRAVKEDSFARDAYYLIGRCSEEVGKYNDAAEAYSAAVRLGSDKVDIHINLAQSLLKDGDPDGALKACWTAIRYQPNNYEAFTLLATIYNALGQYKDALAGSHVARKIDASKAQAFYQQGVALRGMGKNEQAVNVLKKALDIDPEMKKAYWDLAMSYYRSGDVRAASDICGALKNIDPAMSDKLSAEFNK